jgi:hypothetical protein
MKGRSHSASVLMVLLSLTFTLFSVEASAQNRVLLEKKPQAPKPVKEVSPVTQPSGMRTAMSDLTCPGSSLSVERKDSPQGPFTGECNCCFQQGYMLMNKVMCYVRNVGNGASLACQAKLTWVDRNNVPREKVVDIPALEAGKHTIVIVVFDSAQSFSVASPVTLNIDHLNRVVESIENNNSATFDFEQFRQQYSYQFADCQ